MLGLWSFERLLWASVGCPQVENTAANAITILRGKLVLYGCSALYALYYATSRPHFLMAVLATIVLAAMLDGVDGFIAKKLHCPSESGRCLDPVADSILIFAGFLVILSEYNWDRMLALPVVGITVLGLLIFLLRVRGAKTHVLARTSVAYIYAGGVCFFAAIAAKHMGKSDSALLTEIFATGWGYSLFWLALCSMAVSACYYLWIGRSGRYPLIAATPAE